MASLAIQTGNPEIHDHERIGHPEKTQWVLNAPEPPSLWQELMDSVRETTLFHARRFPSVKDKGSFSRTVISSLQAIFPIFCWCRNYKTAKFKKDLLAGLTLASLCIPQSIGYATLAKLDPQYGLYTSVIPPLIYAVMGTSRDIAIGPVAVVSLLLSSMIPKLEDPEANPVAYRNLVLTTTFFAGIFQASFGLFRLGFLVDFLSHAAIVGFVAGAAIVIGLQQMKGLLGITHFTNKTDVISVMEASWRAVHHSWNPHNFLLGCSFLTFILITRFVGRRNKKLFWLPAIAPLISVVLSTLLVYLTSADEHGILIIKHIKKGLNPTSFHQLQFNNPHIGEVAKIGLIVAVVALTEAIAVGRSFASIKGYRINGNQEMVAMGFMNILGSVTSCYVATGSFSRSAVNFSAGCETAMSNIVMAITVIVSLELFTRLLYFTPIAILSAIILSALPGLVDFHEAYMYGFNEQKMKNQQKMYASSFSNSYSDRNVNEEESMGKNTNQAVILDMSNLTNIDVSGIASLEELHKNLASSGKELAITNPNWQVIHKLRVANFVTKIGGRVFLTIGEAEEACLGAKMAAV
ncbi:SULFATE TRANSPORTER [Salix viminalis]|uniref:SULFATE TRANSPORTER n=1 Tax=Salix viminalis TaxID=40686 RepID=A0A9Q0NY14_SALVM|nr:SULFATE TRANSPORTER [Salix viminalis]